MNDMIQHLWSRFLHVADAIFDTLEQGTSFESFQHKLKEELDALGNEAIRLVIEQADKRLRDNRSERRGWVIAQRDNKKTLLTQFGSVSYRRTNFKNKALRSHRHLVDDQIGVRPHQKVDGSLQAELVERAVSHSYRVSGRWSENASWHVSGQTVMNAIREMDTSAAATQDLGSDKRTVRYIFIQADEDHVPNQDTGGRWEPRLITVHEGVRQRGKRRQLVQTKHFGGLYLRATKQLWEEVWQYLDATYDLAQVSKIIISGDGASWIRQGCEVIPGAVFALDRYHALQAVTRVAGNNMALRARMWDALTRTDRTMLQETISEARQMAATESKLRTIDNCERYFRRQWDGIVAWRTYDGIWPGCSAEGHISHIYAKRLSSRPLAWRRTGVDQMSRLRVMAANGQHIRSTYLKQNVRRAAPIQVATNWIKESRQALKNSKRLHTMVEMGLPSLMKGRRTQLTRALRAVVGSTSF